MRNDADDLLKLAKDAVAIISIYNGDLVRALYHQLDRTGDRDGFDIAIENAKEARWWLERAARVLGCLPPTLLDESLGLAPAPASAAALDDQTRALLDRYVRSTGEVRRHIAATIAAVRTDNIRLRRRLRMLKCSRREITIRAD